MSGSAERDALAVVHQGAWRDPAQVVSQWIGASEVDPRLLSHVTTGDWWGVLGEAGVTLLVTREYEHLLVALRGSHPGRVTYLQVPHPSGVAVDRRRDIVHLASTRNPNQVFELAPVTPDGGRRAAERVLIPIRSQLYPGRLYLHDLALVGGGLHANAVGENAVVELHDSGRYRRAWWPRCIERNGKAVFGRNHIQLNSIAAGESVETSYFSASSCAISGRRPGHRNYPVDKRGVLFAGATREPIVTGLTRPHSARRHKGRVWVDNSGYGEVGIADIRSGNFVPVARLQGWTRGLCFAGDVAFVATSRVIPRFRQYAPGLDVDHSVCGVHALNARTGARLASIVWPYGNQVFAVDWMRAERTSGLPFCATRGNRAAASSMFYSFSTSTLAKESRRRERE